MKTVFILYGLAVLGYILNIIQLFGCDFAEPWKEEILRIVGAFFPPLGCVIGYIPF